MLESEPTGGAGATDAPATDTSTDPTTTPRRRTAKRAARAAAEPAAAPAETPAEEAPAPRRKRATKATKATRTAAATATPAEEASPAEPAGSAEQAPPVKKATRRRATKATAEQPPLSADAADQNGAAAQPAAGGDDPAPVARRTAAKRTTRARRSAEPEPPPEDRSGAPEPRDAVEPAAPATPPEPSSPRAAAPPSVMFVAPALAAQPARAPAAAGSGGAADDQDAADQPAGARRRRSRVKADAPGDADQDTGQAVKAAKAGKAAPAAGQGEPAEVDGGQADEHETDSDSDSGDRRRRRRGRRGRGKGRADGEAGEAGEAGTDGLGEGADTQGAEETAAGTEVPDGAPAHADVPAPGTRRRRHRRRGGAGADAEVSDDPPNTVVHVRESRSADEVQSVRGSTRLEAKRQRRRDGREQGRRRAPILTESEFLARREAVDRVMVVRQRGERTQIAVLEDGVLVEHYISRATSTSYAGNVYLGRVQNVLPSMEAAFVDIGKGRNAVLYAGEVNWDAAGLDGRPRQIEQVLKSGDTIVVQVTKDPIGHKGARLTSQVSLPGRYLVFVPGGSMTGISRKLPDTERQRLKDILRRIVPDDAGVIIRTAAEGASEEELGRDVARLQAQWEIIQKKAASSSTSVPSLLYSEPDLAIRVVRDIFNEDFGSLVVSGDEVWDTLEQYVAHVAPDLTPRLHRHTADTDVFAEYRVDEQLTKALDRKVWLPSGGSLIIDRTEAMAVIDVNTGKFTGSRSGGSLEETVTRNNLEAAEEIVRQLRLRDIGGIIVIDFIDMVLESNRDLVLRRLTECLGRDRTKHQVAEVTSLGLVQMTRKRVGQGLLEAFSEPCEVCRGRGVLIHTEPAEEPRRRAAAEGSRRRRGGEPSVPPAAEQVPAPVEPPAAEVSAAEVSEQDGGPSAEDVEAAAAQAAGVSEETVQPSPGASEEPEVEATPRRRRRRAASRPAGPPVPATVTSASA